MIRNTMLAAVAAGSLAAFATDAAAATATFEFSGNTIPTNMLEFTSGGLSVSVVGRGFFTNTGTLSGSEFKIGQYAGGLGICSGTVVNTGDYCQNDDHQVDGDLNEMAVFTFSEMVRLVSVGFSLIGSNDDFAVRIYDGSPNGGYNSSIDPGPNGSPTYAFMDTITGTIFGIGAQGDNDEFKIRNITVEYEPSVVPLPAAGWMLLAGLGGIAALKRRKAA